MSGKMVSMVMAALTVLVGACAPAARPAGTTTGAAPYAGSVAPSARVAKTLTIAQDFEPPDIESFGSIVRPAGSGGLREIVHNKLSRRIRDGVVQPPGGSRLEL